MARVNIPLTTLAPNSIVDIPVGTSINVASGMTIALASSAIPVAPTSANILLYVANTAGSDKTVIVRGGVGGGATPGQAFRSGLGDLSAIAHSASGGGVIGPIESARFAQLDNSISIDFQSGTTGAITAFIMPTRW